MTQSERTMPLCNRVDPFGQIHAVAARGTFTGNRGVIHDPDAKALLRRRWTTKAWIVCALDHPVAQRRDPMGRNAPSGRAGWTELFFLDEVTALAAGHRPCFHCRREAAMAFSEAFGAAAGGTARAADIDASLHRQRPAAGAKPPRMTSEQLRALPDGAMFSYGGNAFAMRGSKPLSWSFGGYGAAPASCRTLPPGAVLLTPPATVAALRAGYPPAWHPSAASASSFGA
jgi:hypothetical protein